MFGSKRKSKTPAASSQEILPSESPGDDTRDVSIEIAPSGHRGSGRQAGLVRGLAGALGIVVLGGLAYQYMANGALSFRSVKQKKAVEVAVPHLSPSGLQEESIAKNRQATDLDGGQNVSVTAIGTMASAAPSQGLPVPQGNPIIAAVPTPGGKPVAPTAAQPSPAPVPAQVAMVPTDTPATRPNVHIVKEEPERAAPLADAETAVSRARSSSAKSASQHGVRRQRVRQDEPTTFNGERLF